MKKTKLITVILILSLIFISSCNKVVILSPNNIVLGYVTDTLGVALENIKLTIFVKYEDTETEHSTVTNSEGYYYIKYKRKADIHYYVKPTSENYIYPILNNNYPAIANGAKENNIDIEMVKLGKVKIEGNVMCSDEDFYWLDSVKISVLKRPNGNTDYPEELGIEVYTNSDKGSFYIEYEGDENYEYFLKPEKEGYYYNRGEEDYLQYVNTDPGYIIGTGLEMKKKN